jgi:P-aminobenzoate N-oxygenase AurF
MLFTTSIIGARLMRFARFMRAVSIGNGKGCVICHGTRRSIGKPFRRALQWEEFPYKKRKSLPATVRWEAATSASSFLLSSFLHGEQGALLVAAQIVAAAPHLDGKFYAATQTLDEARHVEVFSAYINKLGKIHPIAPSMKRLLDMLVENDSFLFKCVGMQVVLEGIALFTFRDMRNTTKEPLLKQLLTYVGRDEARHTAFGIQYLRAVLPTISETERAELEDYAFEVARMLMDTRLGPSMRQTMLETWASAGVDPKDVMRALVVEQDKLQAIAARRGGRKGPLTGFVVPTLQAIDLYSERLDRRFRDLYAQASHAGGQGVMDSITALPEDLDMWINDETM